MARFSSRRRYPWWRTPLFVCAGAGLIGIFAAVTLWKTDVAVIRGIRIEGASVLSPEEISTTVKESLAKPIFGFVPSNLIFLPAKRLHTTLLEHYPRLETVQLKRNFVHRVLEVIVGERATAGIYCRAMPAATVPEGSASQWGEAVIDACYFMDRNGVIFGEAPETEGALFLSLVDFYGSTASLGQSVFSGEIFIRIETLWKAFHDEVRIGISRLVRYDEELLVVQTFEGWEAAFDLQGDVSTQIIALRELLAKELPPKKRTGISVIDLRIPGKIYYR